MKQRVEDIKLSIPATIPSPASVASQRGLSVIIAAHNEEAGIGHTLHSILSNQLDRPLQVIVVANGCTDATAAVARGYGARVQVIETEVGNKVHALNLGDAAARFTPRAYLDADIELTNNALQAVVNLFENDPTARVAAPAPQHSYRGHNWFLAGYYKLWSSLPYVRNAVMGSGFYAIDRELRGRFDYFPSITADDKFICTLAKPGERRVLANCGCTVLMPATFKDLLRVKTRWSYGNMELADARPDLKSNDEHRHQGTLSWLIRRPGLWIHVPTFLGVFAYTRLAARRRRKEKQNLWDRDDSSRPTRGSAVRITP